MISAVSPTFSRSVDAAIASPQKPAVRVQAAQPKFGMDPVAVSGIGFSVAGMVSMFGTAFTLAYKMNRWERQLRGIKDDYGKLEQKEREGFLKKLPERIRNFEENPSLVFWHSYTTRAELSRQSYEAHDELHALTSAMWTHTTMESLLAFFKDTKRETLEHPAAFKHPKVVYSWAAYLEAMHLVTKAGNNGALTPEQKHDWYRALDKKWETTPILKRPALTDAFEAMTTQMTDLIKKHTRKMSQPEVQRAYAAMVRELSEDPETGSAMQAILAENEDVEFDDLPPDPSDLDPTFDEKELQRRDDARAIRTFREQLESLSAEDFMD